MLSKQQIDDFKWFVGELPELYQTYGHCWLAIKNKRVLGTYGSMHEGVTETRKEHAPGTFIVQECGDSPSVYTVEVASAWA